MQIFVNHILQDKIHLLLDFVLEFLGFCHCGCGVKIHLDIPILEYTAFKQSEL